MDLMKQQNELQLSVKPVTWHATLREENKLHNEIIKLTN